MNWVEGKQGLFSIGGDGAHFTFDCERPRHAVVAIPHFLASRPVNNSEWMTFILDGGYDDARFWLSDGWAWVDANNIEAPLYWRRNGEGDWITFGLSGLCDIDRFAPVSHISFYEADAYASWAGARLPTEAEWENAASLLDPHNGNLLDQAGVVRPKSGGVNTGAEPFSQMFGDVWEWTGSAYRPYPGFTPESGTIGEYNGKFMSGQFVLKGGSCATPRSHIRASYRNFFAPHQRWQFSGLRLAKDYG